VIALALDASTTAIGWALFDFSKRHPDDLLGHGVEKLTGELWARIWQAKEWFLWEREGDKAQLVAIETPVIYMVKQHGGPWKPRNAQSVIKQAYMVGTLGVLAYAADLEIMELRPDERLTALGLAHNTTNPKPQVVNLVNQIYSLELNANTEHDIADAIALGWAARRRLMQEGRIGDGADLTSEGICAIMNG
jgi:Holliday junction resolvasome RuvABC endonuclease subunit